MQLKIKHERINDSPFSKNDNSFFIEKNSNDTEQFKQDILNGTPTCYLVSGYRGSGKTSLLKHIDDKLDSKKHCFAYANFSRYEPHELVLRKIIRALFFAISKNKTIDEKIVHSIKKLYLRTFYNIENKTLFKETKTTNKSLKIQLDLPNIIALILVVLSGINLQFSFLQTYITPILDLITLIGGLAFFCTKNIDFTTIFKKDKNEEEKIETSEMYDNEIAEYHLINFLKMAKENSIKITIVIDELDKIDDIDSIISLINELKPLMLSGLCNFVLLAGQKLYYNFKKAQVTDDSALFSIFSKTVHTTLFLKEDFINLFKIYLEEENKIENENVLYYLNSLILQSNKLPRKFINLIRQQIVWDKNTAYLLIDESNNIGFKNDTKLLEIIDEINNNHVHTLNHSEPVKDFFLVQLHLFTQKIKIIQGSFAVEDLLISKDYSSEIYPLDTEFELKKLSKLLLDKLYDNDLLDKEEDSNSPESTLYSWKEDVILNETVNSDFTETLKFKFINIFIQFEKILREIFNNTYHEYSKKHERIINIYEKLIHKEIIINTVISNSDFREIIKVRNELVHVHNNNYEEKYIKNYEILLKKASKSIYEDYTFYLTKEYLEQYYFNLKYKDSEGFDFSAVKNKNLILFEVKVNNLSVSEIINKFIQVKENSKDYTKKLIIIYYEKNMKKANAFINKFNMLCSDYNLENEIKLCYMSDEYYLFDRKRLINNLNNLIDKYDFKLNEEIQYSYAQNFVSKHDCPNCGRPKSITTGEPLNMKDNKYVYCGIDGCDIY